jgi:hypothetical protein
MFRPGYAGLLRQTVKGQEWPKPVRYWVLQRVISLDTKFDGSSRVSAPAERRIRGRGRRKHPSPKDSTEIFPGAENHYNRH